MVLNNCLNDKIVNVYNFPFAYVTITSATYVKVTGSDLTIDVSKVPSFTKAKVAISWGQFMPLLNSTRTATVKVVDQAGTDISGSEFAQNLVTGASYITWGSGWAVGETPYFTIPAGTTSVSLSVKVSATGVTISTAKLILMEN